MRMHAWGACPRRQVHAVPHHARAADGAAAPAAGDELVLGGRRLGRVKRRGEARRARAGGVEPLHVEQVAERRQQRQARKRGGRRLVRRGERPARRGVGDEDHAREVEGGHVGEDAVASDQIAAVKGRRRPAQVHDRGPRGRDGHARLGGRVRRARHDDVVAAPDRVVGADPERRDPEAVGGGGLQPFDLKRRSSRRDRAARPSLRRQQRAARGLESVVRRRGHARMVDAVARGAGDVRPGEQHARAAARRVHHRHGWMMPTP